MVRRDVAGVRVARAASWLDDAARSFSMPEAEFLQSVKDRDLAVFYLFLAIQECLDLAAHWVADAGWGAPDDAASTFDTLVARAAMPSGLADSLRQAVGLRNRIAHGYALLDYARVRREALAGIPALRAFLSSVAAAAGL